jgi:hypothetical protein
VSDERSGVAQELWNEHGAWSTAADKLKSTIARSRSLILGLTIAGAALQTLAATVSSPNWRFGSGLVGFVALALVPVMSGYFLTPAATRKWLRARSISEGIKSEFYRFRAAADPYSGADRLDVLRHKVREIRDFGKDIEEVRARVHFASTPAPADLDAGGYLDARIFQQIKEYYRPKAQRNAELAERFRSLQIALAIAAAALGAAATVISREAAGGHVPLATKLASWVAVMTTIGGSLAAHAAASRYEFQTTTFFATARQLEDLTQDWRSSGKSQGSPEWSEFVRACEEVISAENRAWMAKIEKE